MDNVVDSNQQLLKNEEIIQKAGINTKASMAYPEAYQTIMKELTMPGTQALRHGNTIFIIHYDHGRVGTFRALNADTAPNYVKNGVEFVKAAYTLGYDVLITQYYEPSINNIFKMIFQNPPNKDMGYQTKRTNRGFVTTLTLGPERGGEI